MSEDRLFQEEELLESVSPLPALSSGLRVRVLAAAVAARERRFQGRCVAGTALVVFGLFGLFTWSDPLSLVAGRSATSDPSASNLAATDLAATGAAAAADSLSAAAPETGSPALPVSSGYCRRDMLISAMGDDWRMVEAEFKSREEFTRRVHM